MLLFTFEPGNAKYLSLKLTHQISDFSKALDESHLTPGEDFSLVTLSIDPTEGSKLSKEKKNKFYQNKRTRWFKKF